MQCTKCNGRWLTQEELGAIVKNHVENFPSELVVATLRAAHAGLSPEEAQDTFGCPMCSKPMAPLNYNYCSGVIINVCSQDHGLWFDKDELEKVEIEMQHANKREQEDKPKLIDALAREASAERREKLAKDRKLAIACGPIHYLMWKIVNGRK
jgi:Zn-finger nucleic acid-binding protein